MIDEGALQALIGKWWWNYDEGNFDVLASLVTDDVHFTCRTDSGNAEWEDFVRADIRGRGELLKWQSQHRLDSPYPLRHNGANVHVVEQRGDDVTYASYIFVTQVVDGEVSNLSSAIVTGIARNEHGTLRIAELNVVLDTMNSELFRDVRSLKTV